MSTTFLLFLIAYTLSQFFRVFLAVIAPELMHDLALDERNLGLMSGAWALAFASAQFPVGYGLDRFGPRRTVALLMIAAAAGCCLLAASNGPAGAITAMALIGIGCAPIYMGALYVFARSEAPSRFALLASWMLAIGSVGNLLAAAPLAWSADLFGWRASLLAVGGLVLVSAVLIATFVRDPPPATTSLAQATGLWHGIKTIAQLKQLWPLLPLVTVSYAVVLAARGLWAGPYLAEVYGLDALSRGYALVGMGLAMSAGALIYGPLEQRLQRRKALVAGGSLLTILAFGTLGLMPRASLGASVALLMIVGAAGHTYTVLMAHGRQFLPEHLIGRGITSLNFLFIGGVALIQALSGVAMARFTAVGATPEMAYGALFSGFAMALLAALTVYLRSKDQ